MACFENAARHLRPGGRFVIENGVPPWSGGAGGPAVIPFSVTDDHVGLDELVDGTHGQVSRSVHFRRRDDGTWERFSAPFRYVWPAELDLMARLAGMALEHRWADWNGGPFTADSASHVSVWRRPGRGRFAAPATAGTTQGVPGERFGLGTGHDARGLGEGGDVRWLQP